MSKYEQIYEQNIPDSQIKAKNLLCLESRQQWKFQIIW